MSEAAITATPLSGSFDASFDRRCAYSSAVMPGVTKTFVSEEHRKFQMACHLRSPGPSMWGCVSWTGCPNRKSAAETEAYERRRQPRTTPTPRYCGRDLKHGRRARRLVLISGSCELDFLAHAVEHCMLPAGYRVQVASKTIYAEPPRSYAA